MNSRNSVEDLQFLGYMQFTVGCHADHYHILNHNRYSNFSQGFVIAVTMAREGYDDFKRFLRDREANSQKYKKLTLEGMYFLTY